MPPRDPPAAAGGGGEVLPGRVAAVRRFNRAYTQRIGILNDRYLGESLSLTQSRILYEIGHRGDATAGDIVRDLGLDQGYVSRIVRGFEESGLVRRTRSETDARKSHLALTDLGREELATLDARANAEVAAMLGRMSAETQAKVVEAMRTIEDAIAGRELVAGPFVLRGPGPGDLGWIVEHHGAHCGGKSHEADVAAAVASFSSRGDARRERCWIAERGGERVASVLVVAQSPRVARADLLLVAPAARRHGLGRSLLEECARFARQAGYARLAITPGDRDPAFRRLADRAGFRAPAGRARGAWELTL